MEPLKEGAKTGRSCEACDPNKHNDMRLYGITIKPTYNSLKKKNDIDALIKKFYDYCDDKGYKPLQHTIEKDKKQIFHLHGVMEAIPFNSGNDPLKYYAGWHIDVVYIYELVGWDSYIRKDQGKDPLNEYAFIDT